jgi:hypothetical protein
LRRLVEDPLAQGGGVSYLAALLFARWRPWRAKASPLASAALMLVTSALKVATTFAPAPNCCFSVVTTAQQMLRVAQ